MALRKRGRILLPNHNVDNHIPLLEEFHSQQRVLLFPTGYRILYRPLSLDPFPEGPCHQILA